VEHRARVKIHHLVLFAAKDFTSAQLFFSGFNSLRILTLVSAPPYIPETDFHIHFHIKKLSCQICPAFLHFGFFNHLGFGYVGD
jgi:hypothetical protein